MNAIILAAGEGRRLRPLTETMPKCMVEVYGKPMLGHILDTLNTCGITEITIAGGYRIDAVQNYIAGKWNAELIRNPDYAETNMVYTLFQARDKMKGNTIISYSDIIYNKKILKELMDKGRDISIAVDMEWESLWKLRMDNPLNDAETMVIKEGLVKELGGKTTDINMIQGQYMGLIYISDTIIEDVKMFYDNLTLSMKPEELKIMFMTDFLTALIESGFKIHAVPVSGGWLEADTMEDLEKYQNNTDLKNSVIGNAG